MDPKIVAEYLVADYRSGLYRGLGSTTTGALNALEAGAEWFLAGGSGEYARGNGAAMRIAPVGFAVDVFSPSGKRSVRDIASITHRTEEAIAGALAMVFGLQLAWEGRYNVLDVVDCLFDSNVRDALTRLSECPPSTVSEAVLMFGNSGIVHETVGCAFACAAIAVEDGLEAVWLELIAAGGDSDTISSLVGQIAGAQSVESSTRLLDEFLRKHRGTFESFETFTSSISRGK